MTEPCEGKCNDSSVDMYGARHYKSCYSKKQCVKISQWKDDKIDCWDRSDEEEDGSGAPPIDWQMKECGSKDYPGLTWDGAWDDCLAYSDWCNDKIAATCPHLGGLTSLHQDVCGNHTFWHLKTCRWWSYDGVRCSSARSGQCFYPDTDNYWLKKTCDDGSDQIHLSGSKCSKPADPNECTSSCLTPLAVPHAQTPATSPAREMVRMSALVPISAVTSTPTVTKVKMRMTVSMFLKRRG